MALRWRILAVLFAARLTMAFQFQAVAALSPVYQSALGIGLGDVGLLIGLYLLPGVVMALPGGALGQRFGDRNVVAASLALMVAGGLAMAALPDWSWQVTGRVLAGIGGVGLNVVMTKMVTDWFAGREIGTAMGVYVNSWPVGIALALLVLPQVAASAGLSSALLLVPALAAGGLALLLLYYRAPPAAGGATVAASEWPRGRFLALGIMAGAIWGLFNAALVLVFSFGPVLLTELGYTLAGAGSRVSLVLWGVTLSTPLGGLLADRWNRDAMLAIGLIGFAGALAVTVGQPDRLPLLFVLGLAAGLCPAAIMSLPAQALPPPTRSIGMGIYFTLYYAGIVSGPILAGRLADSFGSASVAFWLASALLLAAVVVLMAFRRVAARREAATAG